MANQANLFFCLGGEDNEMAEIKRILNRQGIPFFQPQLEWGTIKISKQDLPLEAGQRQLVFVECRPGWINKLDYPKYLWRQQLQVKQPATELLIIDHHNELCHRPVSLLQVLRLLNLNPGLRQQIIASIDANFLRRTIRKWPTKKSAIIRIWENGYRQAFDRPDDYLEFKKFCRNLYDTAVSTTTPGELLMIEQSPSSMTMISAFADLDNRECCLIAGKLADFNQKPCFYQGNRKRVEYLLNRNWSKCYWGKYYLGCRAVPSEFWEYCQSFSPVSAD